MMIQWRKSTYSHLGGIDQGNCIEVGDLGTERAIRDSKLGDASPVIHLTPEALRDLVEKIR